MDIQKLLNRKSARKEGRKNKKKLKKIIKRAKVEKISPDEAVSAFFNKGKKKKRHQKQKSKTKVAKANRAADRVHKELEEGLSEEEAFFSEIKQATVQALKDEMVDDDQEIKKYEKLLGLGKKRKSDNVPRSIVESGIADLWEFCETDKRKKLIDEEDEGDLGLAQLKSVQEPGKIELAENVKPRKRKHVQFDLEDDNEEESDDDIEEDFDEDCDLEQEMDDIDNVLFNEGDSDLENGDVDDDDDVDIEDGGFDDDEMFEDDGDMEGDDDEMDGFTGDEDDGPQVKEDIYGRTIDLKTGKVINEGTSVGAQQKLEELNKNNPELAEQRFKIGKTLRGALNRLNERTLVTAIRSLEELFNVNSHNDVKTIFYDSIVKATQTIYLLPDRLLIEYAVFIALAHINVSTEVSSHFVESLTMYLLKAIESNEDRTDKALENATALLAHLFNFRVIKPHYVIDVFTRMRNLARENTVSLLMHGLTSCGDTLKKRAGTLLQTFVSDTQNFFTDLSAEKKTVRMKYLIEDLMAAKNGAILTVTSKFDISQVDHYAKLLKTLTKKADNPDSELPFSVDDVVHITERGRWWVVGSAWKPSDDKNGSVNVASANQKKQTKFGDDLMELARKAKMNTEMRKNVFCTIVGSEDDMEAFERLIKLGLKGTQEREIIHISIVCTMMEASYNQYYSTIIERFCNYHKRFILTTQFALWDRINDLESLKKRQRINIAFLTADLIQMGCLPLSVLKVINFGIIEVTTTAFLRRTFYRLLSKSTLTAVTKMFKKIAGSEALKSFVEGLRLFFEISMRPESVEETEDPLIAKKIELVNELLSVDDY